MAIFVFPSTRLLEFSLCRGIATLTVAIAGLSVCQGFTTSNLLPLKLCPTCEFSKMRPTLRYRRGESDPIEHFVPRNLSSSLDTLHFLDSDSLLVATLDGSAPALIEGTKFASRLGVNATSALDLTQHEAGNTLSHDLTDGIKSYIDEVRMDNIKSYSDFYGQWITLEDTLFLCEAPDCHDDMIPLLHWVMKQYSGDLLLIAISKLLGIKSVYVSY